MIRDWEQEYISYSLQKLFIWELIILTRKKFVTIKKSRFMLFVFIVFFLFMTFSQEKFNSVLRFVYFIDSLREIIPNSGRITM